jgi:hypothetical protein
MSEFIKKIPGLILIASLIHCHATLFYYRYKILKLAKETPNSEKFFRMIRKLFIIDRENPYCTESFKKKFDWYERQIHISLIITVVILAFLSLMVHVKNIFR